MYRTIAPSTLSRRIGLSFLMGFSLFALGALLQAVLEKNNVHGLMLYLDDVMLGLVAGLMVFVYEQKRHRALIDKIRVIAAMNHHVRNALQAIAFSRYAEERKQVQMLDESTRRIQWALQEILPGEVEPVAAEQRDFTAR